MQRRPLLVLQIGCCLLLLVAPPRACDGEQQQLGNPYAGADEASWFGELWADRTR